MSVDRFQALAGSEMSERTADTAWRDDLREHVSGRLVALAGVVCVVPPLMLLSPALLAAGLPVVVASFVSAALALVGVHYRSALLASVLAVCGVAALALAPLFEGLSAGVVVVAALAVALEILIASGLAQRRVAMLGCGVLIGVAIVAYGSAAPVAAAGQVALAVVLLPLAPLVILFIGMHRLRRQHQARTGGAMVALRREEAMLDAGDVAVMLADSAAQVLDVTASAARLLDGAAGSLLGRGLVDRVLIADRPAFLNAVSDAALSAVSQTLTLRLATGAMASERPGPLTFGRFALTIRPSSGGAGTVAVVMRAAAGEEATDTLLRLAGPDLFATLSHEVRTPMNAILGFSEILSNEALAPRDPVQVAEYASIIHRSAHDAFAVTRAVVDLLRVEAGEFEAGGQPVFLAEALGGVIATISGREPEGGCTFDIEAALSDDAQVEADPQALRILLSTLIEGLMTARSGALDIVCAITSVEGRPAVTMSVRPRVELPVKDLKHAALLQVVGLLVRRIAGTLAAEVEFDPPHGARLVFGVSAAVPVRRHRPAETAVSSRPVVPLRKSA